MTVTHSLAALGADLFAGSPQVAGSLVVLPLLLRQTSCVQVRADGSTTTLARALTHGDAEVVELDGGASVPTLTVKNRGALPLLLLDGEELVGAKQNRVLNTSVLVPAHASLEVPVSCVERGRWRHISRSFETRSRSMPARMKRDKMMRVTHSLRATRRFDADQGRVWADIDEYATSRGVRSQTSALGDVFEADETTIRDTRAGLRVEPGQVGLATWLDGELLGVELLFGPTVFAEAFDRIVHSYVAEAIRTPSRRSGVPADITDVRRLLARIGDAPSTANPSPGLGTDLRLDGRSGSAAVLLDDEGRVVHVVAFKRAA